jgi:hypothetical protein
MCSGCASSGSTTKTTSDQSRFGYAPASDCSNCGSATKTSCGQSGGFANRSIGVRNCCGMSNATKTAGTNSGISTRSDSGTRSGYGSGKRNSPGSAKQRNDSNSDSG